MERQKTTAIVVEKTGGPEVLVARGRQIDPPGEGEVLVELAATGVNYVDVYQRNGTFGLTPPFVPGFEGAGVVAAVGSGAEHRFAPGDRVAYARAQGAYAAASVVPADALIPVPHELSFTDAAAFPMQGITAHYLMHQFRMPQAGDVVLVHAAAGGVGRFLVQWSHHVGARVIGTVSTEAKAEVARQAGADDVINYREYDFAERVLDLTGGSGADIVFDGVGGDTLRGDLRAAAIHGHITVFGAAGGEAEALAPQNLMSRSVSLAGADVVNGLGSREQMLARAQDVIAGLSQGWLSVCVHAVLPLKEAARAHEMLEDRSVTGKVLLTAGGVAPR